MLERSSHGIRLPVGVRDFLPRAAARRRSLAEALLGEFERWGYERIITPAFEYLDVLARGMGDDARAAAIRFVEPATGEVVALRPDITPQVARIAATRLSDVGGPIRLCYEGAVLRLTAGARGQREIIQAGVELLDAPSPEGDAEVIALAAAALAAAGAPGVVIDCGHVAVLREALDGVPEERADELRTLIGKKDESALEAVADSLGLGKAQHRLLAALPGLWGDPGDVLARARKLPLGAAARHALADLELALILAGEQDHGVRFTLDLGEVRGFDYYTGVRFAGYLPSFGDAVLRGGRYDELVVRYGRAARATGFAVDVEALAQAEKARGVDPPTGAPGVLITVEKGSPARLHDEARALAPRLRAAGLRVALDLGVRAGDAAARTYAAGVGLQSVLVLGKRSRLLDGEDARPITAVALAARGSSLVRALGLSEKPRPSRSRSR